MFLYLRLKLNSSGGEGEGDSFELIRSRAVENGVLAVPGVVCIYLSSHPLVLLFLAFLLTRGTLGIHAVGRAFSLCKDELQSDRGGRGGGGVQEAQKGDTRSQRRARDGGLESVGILHSSINGGNLVAVALAVPPDDMGRFKYFSGVDHAPYHQPPSLQPRTLDGDLAARRTLDN
jgi:hypothetical protein